MSDQRKPRPLNVKPHKMPENSLFYDKILPGLFVVLGVATVVLILFAVGVLAGIVPWK